MRLSTELTSNTVLADGIDTAILREITEQCVSFEVPCKDLRSVYSPSVSIEQEESDSERSVSVLGRRVLSVNCSHYRPVVPAIIAAADGAVFQRHSRASRFK